MQKPENHERFNEINEKGVDDFNESEESQSIRRKAELDVDEIHSWIGENGRTVALENRYVFK